jgi:hypothetical protein
MTGIEEDAIIEATKHLLNFCAAQLFYRGSSTVTKDYAPNCTADVLQTTQTQGHGSNTENEM